MAVTMADSKRCALPGQAGKGTGDRGDQQPEADAGHRVTEAGVAGNYPVAIITWVGLPVDSLESIGRAPIYQSLESIGLLHPRNNNHWVYGSRLAPAPCALSDLLPRRNRDALLIHLVGMVLNTYSRDYHYSY